MTSLLTTEAQVLLLVARNPLIRYHEIATAASISVRTVERIVLRLEEAGYIRRKPSTSLSARYEVRWDCPISDNVARLTVGELVDRLSPSP